jgi:hypothetical protein
LLSVCRARVSSSGLSSKIPNREISENPKTPQRIENWKFNEKFELKGIVQQKLRSVESGVNQ